MSAFKDVGFGYCDYSDSWVIPVRTERGTVQDLRTLRWKTKLKKIISTAGCKAGLLGLDILAKASPKKTGKVFVTEGEWDYVALKWILKRSGRLNDVVVAVPGCRIFKVDWERFFKGHHVVFLYDNDNDGEISSYKAGHRLTSTARKVEWINWPDSLAEKYDIRDMVVELAIKNKLDPPSVLSKIEALVKPVHKRHEELKGTTRTSDDPARDEDDKPVHKRPKSNPTFEQTLQVFRKWLRMTPDLEDALLALFAVVFSNQVEGDPLWLFLVGPPGSGKSELLCSMMRLAETGDVFFQSSVSAKQLVSGWKDTKGTKDPSMIPRMMNKTTVFKDWTEMLAGNQQTLEETYSLLRGAYDGHVFKPFGNGVTREYHGRFSLLAGVTNIIHGHSTVALGERFMKFQLSPMTMQSTKSLLEAALRGVAHEETKNKALQEATLAFMDRDVPKLSITKMLPKEYWTRIIALAEIVSILRHQVTRDFHQDVQFHQSPEVGTRLVKQLGKLAMGVAFTLGKAKVDDKAFRIVERVAFDTAIGFNLDIVQAAMDLGGDNFSVSELALQSSLPESTVRRRMEDMILTKIMLRDQKVAQDRGAPKWTYKLSKRIRTLWKEAKVQDSHINSAIAGRMPA